MLRTSALDYDLPPDRIATSPATPRDSARLLVVSCADPSVIVHAQVRDLPDFLALGDRMVCNTTRVLPARFRGQRAETGGKVQGLYLCDDDQPGGLFWIAMIKSRRHRPGMVIRLFDQHQTPTLYTMTLVDRVDDPAGAWRVQIHTANPCQEQRIGSALTTPTVLESVGLPPLPPYILAARLARHQAELDPHDRDSYQTVYAQLNNPGSVAAPTAGLHFTPSLLDNLAQHNIARSNVVLDVGAGTFKPVEAQTVEAHPIHQEWCAMDSQTIEEIVQTRAQGGRVLAIGTTSVRTIESYARLHAAASAQAQAQDLPARLSTRLLITPGDRLLWTDCLLTNFHLPRSTLMALVAAMLEPEDHDAQSPKHCPDEPRGVTRLKMLYALAIEEGYRFYSFGDAMLLLP